jgi:hypothetical protein
MSVLTGSRPSARELERYRSNWQAQIETATVYAARADNETDPAVAAVYRRIEATGFANASYWEARLREVGAPVVLRVSGWRWRASDWLMNAFG